MPEQKGMSREERGSLGHHIVLEKYGKHRMDQWARKGGRKPNRTIDEINAGIYPQARPYDPTRDRSRRRSRSDARQEAPIAATP